MFTVGEESVFGILLRWWIVVGGGGRWWKLLSTNHQVDVNVHEFDTAYGPVGAVFTKFVIHCPTEVQPGCIEGNIFKGTRKENATKEKTAERQ